MADSQDADIDEIMGQEDLELDELDNESPGEGQQEEEPEEKSEAEPEEKKDDSGEESDSSGESKEDEKSPEETPEVKPEEKKEETPPPLTKEDIQAAFREARESDRASAKELDELTNEVISKYYPEGLSNVLIDDKTGKELKTPQDVVDASDGKLSIEEASRWLMNEQYRVDQNIKKIKDDARNIAETNANFHTGIERVLAKYEPVFKAFEKQGIQEKLYKAYMKQVKMDDKNDLVLSAPDIEEFYDLVMEPYLLAYGNMQARQTSSPSPSEKPPEAPQEKPSIPDSKPSIEDRLDETGDGGVGSDREADPNNADESLNKLFGE